jgi:hypothetical protein
VFEGNTEINKNQWGEARLKPIKREMDTAVTPTEACVVHGRGTIAHLARDVLSD